MKKKLGLIIGMLMCFSIMTIGFAAWIITGDSEEKSAEGTFSAVDVSDQSLGVEITFTDNEISFGVPTSTETQVSWLSYSEGDTQEDFSASATIIVDNYEYLSTLNVSVECDDVSYLEAVEAGLITEISCEVTPEVANTTGEYTVEISIGWGDAFDNKNPFDYYNALSQKDYKTEAYENLTTVFKLNEAKFTLKVQAMDANESNDVTVEATPTVEETA